MYDGRVVQIGTPQELFERPAHTFVGYFIGSPGMNLFDAQISGNAAQVAGTSINLNKTYAPKGGKAQLGVRPEVIRLNGEGLGLPAKVTRVEDVGRHKIIRLDVAGQPDRVTASMIGCGSSRRINTLASGSSANTPGPRGRGGSVDAAE